VIANRAGAFKSRFDLPIQQSEGMNANEFEICEVCRTRPGIYWTVSELLPRLGPHWQDEGLVGLEAVLRRMALEGLVECDALGRFRTCKKGGNTTAFLRALQNPTADLGDTAIITID
jgi:hypothetical protein